MSAPLEILEKLTSLTSLSRDLITQIEDLHLQMENLSYNLALMRRELQRDTTAL